MTFLRDIRQEDSEEATPSSAPAQKFELKSPSKIFHLGFVFKETDPTNTTISWLAYCHWVIRIPRIFRGIVLLVSYFSQL